MNAGHNYSPCKHYVAKKQIVLTLFDIGGGGWGGHDDPQNVFTTVLKRFEIRNWNFVTFKSYCSICFLIKKLLKFPNAKFDLKSETNTP